MEKVATQRICIDTDVIIDYLRETPVYGDVLSWVFDSGLFPAEIRNMK
ncbi:MAG: hypothetical protein AB1414_21285 [bacterium]